MPRHHTLAGDLPSLAERIDQKFNSRRIDVEHKTEAQAHLDEYRDAIRLVDRDGGAEDLILRVLREVQRGERDVERTCGCPDPGCPLKQHRLPRPVQEADDIHRGVFEFRHGHDGEPHALIAGVDEYDRLEHLVERVRREALTILANGEGFGPAAEPDEEDDADEETPTEATDDGYLEV